MVTIFKNIFDKQPYYAEVDKVLERIQKGASRQLVEEIRALLDAERANGLKKNLPSVCFSGKFSERKDDKLLEHSGFIVLDFDKLNDLRDRQEDIINDPHVYACWVSPSGKGLKALVKIADGKKHREHFAALLDVYPDMDRACVNESRVCYESYDPEIYINRQAQPFRQTKRYEKELQTQQLGDKGEIFSRILKWLSNKGDAFVTGERNNFIFKLAAACCRFGLSQDECLYSARTALDLASNKFSEKEAENAIKSAYRANQGKYGTAHFEMERMVDKVTKSEVTIEEPTHDLNERPKDVIFGEDVKGDALAIYENGYEKVAGVGIDELDAHFKMKRQEIVLLSGIGNYGKTTFWLWFKLMRVIKYGEKFAFFSPENNPASEFYHDLTEILLGCDCTPYNPQRPQRPVYEAAYDFVSKHIFYVYPKEIAPTPEYVKERFLELIIKEKVDGCTIDPFNQLANDYGKAGMRSDKYLETFLSDCSRFAQTNNAFFDIIAHPKLLRKDPDGNYPCPDIFDIADGAMWNNKMDDLLIYHRPNHQKDPNSSICELHSKKIRRQKTVGKKGIVEFEFYRKHRRYYFGGADPMAKALINAGLDFFPRQAEMEFKTYAPGSAPRLPYADKDEAPF